MDVTKFTHSCVRLDDGPRRLVIDPGSFSDADETATALDGVDAVLITHEHPDHVDVAALTAAVAENSALRIWCPSSVADLLDSLGDHVAVVGAGEQFDAGGCSVRTFGGQHALIHKDVPVIPNLAYLVDSRVLHPGDSLTVPPAL